MILKKDNFVFGLALGFVAPMIAFLLYKYVKFQSLSLQEMFQWLKMNPNLISVSISVCLMANAILFTVFINSRKDKTAKGIFVLTLTYAIIAMCFKYL